MSDCEKNCEAVAGLNEYAANLIEYSKRIDKWVNGGQEEFVQVGGVSTPTLRNLAMMIKALMGVHPDNKTIFINEDKEIYVNLQNIIQSGGGINIDSDGKLFIDVTSMSSFIYETTMKAIRVPIWLTGNTDFYVNPNHPQAGDNTNDEGRGTINKPFATIQACIDYVINNFNMVGFTATIRIAAGTYNENLTLGEFSHTTGSVVLCPYPGADNQVNIVMQGLRGIYCPGGPYLIYGLNFNMKPQYTSSIWGVARLLYVDKTGSLKLRACKFTMTDYSGVMASNFQSDMFFVFSGSLELLPSLAGEAQMSINMQKAGSHETFVFEAQQQGAILGVPSNLSQAVATISCTGSCTEFIHLERANFTRNGGGSYYTKFSGSMTGKRYNLINGSSCSVGGDQNYFPGNEAGTVEASTYSWYN